MPPLDPASGYLPYRGDGGASVYPVSVEEMRAQFATNEWRAHRMDRWEAWLEDVARAGVQGRAWVGGSFVTAKEHPSDVDVVLLCDPSDRPMHLRAKRNLGLWTLQEVSVSEPSLMVIPRLQPYGGSVDAFFAIATPAQVALWENRWTTSYVDGKPTGGRKGFLEVTR